MCTSFLFKLLQTNYNQPAFYATRRFITVFKRARHRFLFWTTWIRSIHSHPLFNIYYILILPSHLPLGLPNLFPSDFLTKNFACSSCLFHACYISANHVPSYDNFKIWWRVQLWSSSLWCFLHSAITISLLGPHGILLTNIHVSCSQGHRPSFTHMQTTT
jgi:hypothetical protein